MKAKLETEHVDKLSKINATIDGKLNAKLDKKAQAFKAKYGYLPGDPKKGKP